MTRSKIRNEFKLRDAALLFFYSAAAILLFAFNGNAQTTAFVQQAKLTASDGAATDTFGAGVAIDGDTAIVGVPLAGIGANADQGAAYVYIRSGTTWTFQQKLTANDGTNNVSFGSAVDIQGDTAIVGAFRKDTNGNLDQGAVYVFTRTGTTWTQQQKIIAADGARFDYFGSSVAIDGETLAIGSPFHQFGGTNAFGAAYVFTRSGTMWTQQQKFGAGDAEAGAGFSSTVDISGDTIVSSAANRSVNGVLRQGAAYVFTRSGATWSEQQKLTASDGASDERFSNSLSISGNSIVVGAQRGRFGTTILTGAAYVFTRNGTIWTEQQKLNASDALMNDQFGSDVKIEGNMIVVGAYTDDNGAVSNQGAAYIFIRSGTTWTQQQKLTANDGAEEDEFGFRVGLSGNKAIVGARFHNIGANADQGAAYIFVGPQTPTTPRRQFDFDGDGRADLSVFRPSNGIWYLQNSTAGFSGVQFGISTDKIVPADFDGDGRTDLAVYRNGVWYLQRSQLGFTGIQFGLADDIAVPADYDADGKADLAVFRPSNGTWYYVNSSNSQSSAVQFGAGGDKPTIGDFDGDGKFDIAVYRSSVGTWYRINSSNSQIVAVNFGTAEDLVVPADYDADGKTDVAVFRPSSGIWYLQRSQLGFTGIQFGLSGDKPSPADFDGDGRADLGVFRQGIWYLQRSQAGFTGVQFGVSEDLPTPNAFVR